VIIIQTQTPSTYLPHLLELLEHLLPHLPTSIVYIQKELAKGYPITKADNMANADAYKYDFFNVTFPAEYVAHVEINRPEKMNAFMEM
jgi:hypothetical protein